MTGPEHYAKAEQHLEFAEAADDDCGDYCSLGDRKRKLERMSRTLLR